MNRLALLTFVLALASAAGDETSPPPVQLKQPFYYDAEGAGGVWGKSKGLGLVFRIEEGKEVCHVLLFGEGRDIVEDKVLPVARAEHRVTIGTLVCDLKADASTLYLPNGHPIPVDNEAVILTSLGESSRCRYLLTPFVTAKAQAEAEAKSAPPDEAGIWLRLTGTDYVVHLGDNQNGVGLRFYTDAKGGRWCLVVHFGSGRPIVSRADVGVTLKGRVVTIGTTAYRVDSATMALAVLRAGQPGEPAKEGTPAFPDTGILASMLAADAQLEKR